MSEYTLFGNEVASNKPYRTQVFQATHDGVDNRLPLMKRSFISFTYGGKNIEDFGLLAIIENNSMERSLYADFSDNTSETKVLDGQFYWSTHYDTNTLSLALFTDEMTEKQLATFQQWFKPGFARELILAEHPNRGIMARISEKPQYHMLPFEKQITSRLYNAKTSTTAYKGKINLTFIMDEPFWYAIDNILDEEVAGQWRNISTHQLENISTSKDALKIIEEDGIPSTISLKDDVLIGNNITVSVSQRPARTAKADGSDTFETAPETFIGAFIGGLASITQSTNGFSLAVNTNKYFYYAGTAPCAPILEFTINFDTNGSFSSVINNTFTTSTHPYNSIYIKSVTEPREMRITTPGLITAYNQAIKLLSQKNGESLTEVDREEIRDKVNHYKVRAAAINGGLESLFYNTTRATFKINCKTGDTTVTYELKDGNLTEDAGDMIRSNYLKIEDRNYPDEYGYIHAWTEQDPSASHILYHDILNGLEGVKLTYKYMYL